jgi:hypothetical protein
LLRSDATFYELFVWVVFAIFIFMMSGDILNAAVYIVHDDDFVVADHPM